MRMLSIYAVFRTFDVLCSVIVFTGIEVLHSSFDWLVAVWDSGALARFSTRPDQAFALHAPQHQRASHVILPRNLPFSAMMKRVEQMLQGEVTFRSTK